MKKITLFVFQILFGLGVLFSPIAVSALEIQNCPANFEKNDKVTLKVSPADNKANWTSYRADGAQIATQKGKSTKWYFNESYGGSVRFVVNVGSETAECTTTFSGTAEEIEEDNKKREEENLGSFMIDGTNLNNLSEADMAKFNPLAVGGSTKFPDGRTTAGGIVSAILRILYPLVGVLLFALLVWGGIEILMAGTTANSSKAEQGKKRIIAAIVGAVMVFASLIIIKIIEALLGIDLGL